MATASNPTPDPADEYIRNGLRNGTITRQIVSLDAILSDPDHFQARVEHFDMDHVRMLAAIRDQNDGAALSPIMSFFLGDDEPKPFLMADGYHRWREAQIRGADAILAYVAKVPDPRRAALEFATMCNRALSKGRTREDLKRAVFLLLDDEVWRGRSDNWIANHVGVTCGTVFRYRAEHHDVRGIPMPKKVDRANDAGPVPYRRQSPSPPRKVNGHYVVSIGGVDKSYSTKDDAKDARGQFNSSRLILGSPFKMIGHLTHRGLHSKSVVVVGTGSNRGSLGLRSGAFAFAIADLREPNAVALAAGRAILLKRYTGVAHVPLVVCYPEDGPAPMIDLAKQEGIVFLTPDELVSLLKGTDPTQNTLGDVTESP